MADKEKVTDITEEQEKYIDELEDKEIDDKITIKGNEYTIKFPAYSLIKLKKDRGIELKDLEDEEVASDIETIVALIWAGLVHAEDAPTFEDVAKDIEIGELQEVAEKVTKVINGSVKKD